MASIDQAEYYSIKRLRWNTLVFTGGKGVNAMLSLSLFALIASSLSRADFAIYAWLIAFVELSTNLSRFGINWAVDRYVPQLRSTLNTQALRRFLLIMAGLRISVILAMLVVFYWGGRTLLSLSGHEHWLPVFQEYIVILVPFGIMTFFRDVVFQSLLQQAHSQANTTLRHLTFFAILLAALVMTDELTLTHVVYGDITAAVVASLVALLQFRHLLRTFPYEAAPTSSDLPSWRTVARFAANSYANEVLRMSGSGYAVMSAAPHLLATAVLAPYGFCQTLFSQLNRFLPAHLFAGLYRPRLIARYTETGNFGDLNWQLVVILKVSNYILAAGMAVFYAYGAEILALISGGKYADAHGLMLFFLILMLIDNHRQVLMALCNTIERVDILKRASLFLPFVVPVALLLVWAGLGTFGLVAALITADLLCVGTIIHQLRRQDYRLKVDRWGQMRIVLSALITAAIGSVIHDLHADTFAWNLAGIAVVALVFVIVARILRPFADYERNTIEKMLGRRIYVI